MSDTSSSSRISMTSTFEALYPRRAPLPTDSAKDATKPQTPHEQSDSTGSASGSSVEDTESTVFLEKKDVKYETTQLVRKDFHGKIHREMPVVEFVRAVWDMCPEMIPRLPGSSPYTIPHALINAYSTGSERESYTHLAAIMEALLEQLFSRDDSRIKTRSMTVLPDRKVRAHVVNARAQKDKELAQDHAVKPDVSWSTVPDAHDLPWRMVWKSCLAFGEVQRCDMEPLTLSEDLVIDLSLLPRKEKTRSTASSQAKNRKYAAQSSPWKRKRSAEDGDEEERDHKRRCTLPGSSQWAMLRPTEDSYPLDDGEEQAARYIMEMMSRTLRSFASGFSLVDTTMTLWYADRMGIVQSEPFDILKQSHYLLLVAAALGAADLDNFGLLPMFKSDNDFLQATHMSLSAGSLRDIDDRVVKDDLTFDVGQNGGLRILWSTVGQCTSIVPISPTGKAKKIFGSEDLVAKIVWRSVHDETEEHYVRAVRSGLREKAPRYLRYVTDLKGYMTQTMREHNLPRAFMSKLPPYRPRDFNLMVLKKYEPLENVSSVEEFKGVYIDAVRAHRWTYEAAGVLHCDISSGNVMFYREGGRTYGVLSDWDRALSRNAQDEDDDDLFDGEEPNTPASSQPTNGRERSVDSDISAAEKARSPRKLWRRVVPACAWGTPMFMALELQQRYWTPLHRYHHDLESFFFLLVWFCVAFLPAEHKLEEPPEWQPSDADFIVANKKRLLDDDEHWDRMMSQAHPDYKQLLDEWAKPMRASVACANALALSVHSLRDCLDDAQNYRIYDWQRQLVRDLRVKIAKRKEFISYEKFMAVLGAELDISD